MPNRYSIVEVYEAKPDQNRVQIDDRCGRVG